MSVKTEFEEIAEIVKRTMENLISFAGMTGRPGVELRYLTGDLIAHLAQYLADRTFANRLKACFRLATEAGISVDWMDRVLEQLVAEKPTTLASTSVVQNSLILALAQDGRIIAATEYQSRNDVDAMMKRMKTWFDIIRDIIADTMSGPSYEAFLTLTAAITRYLTDAARPLPRMLRYQMATTMPGLAISNYVYGDGGRSEELAAENKIVHPAFMLRTLRALSA